MENVPQHVAIIMDGNGRWAKARNMPRTSGHLEGSKRVEEIIFHAQRRGLKAITFYTFSTENWARPEKEVSMLMQTFITALNRKINDLCKNNIRFSWIGKEENIPPQVLDAINDSLEKTKHNNGMVLNIAFNYGSRLEIVDAVKCIAQEAVDQKISVNAIDEQLISSHLYTKNLPDPDLLIRTSGEQRISNFLLWQLSYAELYFTDKCWPEFTAEEFDNALASYANRDRRFGGVPKNA